MTKLTVRSTDGTEIAYERAGDGPVVVLVGGGLTDRSENAPLVPALAEHFTVLNYDRRGRGASGDAAAYDVGREVEDIDALIAAAGGTAHLYGVSSGGALALEAAAAGSRVGKVAVYEVPYNLAPDWPQVWKSYTDELDRALAADDRGAAFEAFLRVTGTPEQDIAGMRQAPFWSELGAMAHTLPYDAACLGMGQPPIDRLATIRQPVLVLTGDERPPDAARWVLALDEAGDAIATAVLGAERQTLVGQGHVADPDAVAERLIRWWRGCATDSTIR
jgi:pimeloyl-ACP methyl ester carboxylesterase